MLNRDASGAASARFVVTRPSPSDAPLARELERAGLKVIRSPALDLVAYPDEGIRERFQEAGPFDVLVFASPFAAELALRAAPARMLERAALVAPGPGTETVLRDAGLAACRPDRQFSTEGMLELEVLRDPRGCRVGLVGAPGGRSTLEEALGDRGAKVVRLDLYRRIPAAPSEPLLDALSAGVRLAVLLSSAAGAEAMEAGLPERLRKTWRSATFLVPSERIAARLRRSGVRDVVVTGGADAERTIEAARAWASRDRPRT